MKRTYLLIIAVFITICSFGQRYGESIGQQFEESKAANNFDSLKIKIGADFAMQFQNLGQHADSAIVPVGRGFNLPEANLNIDAFLAKGIRVNLVDYLSSRHHDTGIVKGGFIQLDRLPFIQSSVLDKVMDYVTIKIGEMEINYGDSHFRRSDCGRVINNEFVGNYIMDPFTTAPAAEIVAQNNGWLGEIGTTTGTVNQVLTNNTNKYTAINVLGEMAVYGKIGIDKRFSPDFRLRVTLSGFHQGENQGGGYLYGGDRAGSRYYLVMNRQTASPSTDVSIASNFFSGDFPTSIEYTEDNSYVLSVLARYQGFEFFGNFESATGKASREIITLVLAAMVLEPPENLILNKLLLKGCIILEPKNNSTVVFVTMQ